MSVRASPNIARTEGALAPIASSPRHCSNEDQRCVQARRISMSFLGSDTTIEVKRRATGFAQLYDWLNDRVGFLFLKVTKQPRRTNMGSLTDAKTEAWQKECGIEPATGERAKLLRALQQAAFEAIRIIELEHSGIRDGDGYWHGSDVIGHMTSDLTDLCQRLMQNYDEEWKAKHPELATANLDSPF